MSGSVAWLWAALRETMGVEEITATPDWRAVFIPANLAPGMHGRNFRAVVRDVHGARRDIPATHIRAPLAISRRCSHFLVLPRRARHCDAPLTVIVVMVVLPAAAAAAAAPLPGKGNRGCSFPLTPDTFPPMEHLKECLPPVIAAAITFYDFSLQLFFLCEMVVADGTASWFSGCASFPFSLIFSSVSVFFQSSYISASLLHSQSLPRLYDSGQIWLMRFGQACSGQLIMRCLTLIFSMLPLQHKRTT
ncbi:hypothetical protein E2C01_051525 [Portunus trituberculatus]|uniref:Uncharacterized protein n=1 Tax=Portunus trituberculatus TaxID=210409 RepID=A0A5B7GF17_PORTR|nr:hypothetical protein [Portunus trituberculatus]